VDQEVVHLLNLLVTLLVELETHLLLVLLKEIMVEVHQAQEMQIGVEVVELWLLVKQDSLL
jgi:hypothetical protein